MLMQTGFRQIDKQQQRLGKRDDREDAESTAPAKCIGDQGAHRNTEHGGADNAEADFGDSASGVIRPDNVHGRLTGQRPEHR